MDDRLRSAARRIIRDSALVGKDETVLIIHGMHNRDFAGLLAEETMRIGAFPLVWSFDDSLISDFPERPPKGLEAIIKRADVVVWLSQYTAVDNLPEKVRRRVFSFWDAVYSLLQEEKVPTLLVNLPSPMWLEENGIDPDEYLCEFASAVSVDYAQMRQLGIKLMGWLSGAKEVLITDGNGTRLRFSIEGREPGLEDGTLRDCRLERRECEVEIPAGEVYIAPVESSAFGRLVLPHDGLELEFRAGRVVSVSGKRASELRDRLKTPGGNVIAEFGIGLNPGVRPLSLRIFDEKALGTVHVAVGHNLHLGGANESEIHIDFILLEPTVLVDGKMLMERGVIKEQE
ncbi:aminopeptidase [Pyrococcus kukulkanii]|uniref:aminopeptidase n=1 Tax=Pyrococcus kukulkanii TaxID=1609559 RepID=UPI00356402D4